MRRRHAELEPRAHNSHIKYTLVHEVFYSKRVRIFETKNIWMRKPRNERVRHKKCAGERLRDDDDDDDAAHTHGTCSFLMCFPSTVKLEIFCLVKLFEYLQFFVLSVCVWACAPDVYFSPAHTIVSFISGTHIHFALCYCRRIVFFFMKYIHRMNAKNFEHIIHIHIYILQDLKIRVAMCWKKK